MCGRYYSRGQKQKIADHFKAGKIFDAPMAPNYNIAPTTFQPVVRLERDSDERELVLMRWGLVPHFAKSLADFKGFSTFNARAETLTTSATWRSPFKKRRCIIPADGFYEWQKLDDSPKPAKQPYAIRLKSGEPLAFAGLWDAWKEPTGEQWLQSFSIITTEANEIMSSIHTRMPVILHKRDWAEWLDRDAERPAPAHLLRPYDSEEMRTDACNPAVGNVRNNGPEMLNSA
jgi:putative SOS response-associated peptidase YedK